MAGSRAIQSKLVFETTKEGTPTAAKIPADFHPQPFNTSVVGRAKDKGLCKLENMDVTMSLTSPTGTTLGSGHVS